MHCVIWWILKYPNVNDLMLQFHFVEIKLLLKEIGQFKYVALEIAKPQYLILISHKTKFVARLLKQYVEEWPIGWTRVKPKLTVEVNLLD